MLCLRDRYTYLQLRHALLKNARYQIQSQKNIWKNCVPREFRRCNIRLVTRNTISHSGAFKARLSN